LTADSSELLSAAFDEGALSQGSGRALAEVTSEIDQALGELAERAETLLVSVLADDTASIGAIRKRAQAVINGHNRMITAAERRSGETTVLFHTRLIAGGTVSPYRNISRAVPLSWENYSPDARQTPLHQQSIVMLGSVLAKARQLQAYGCQVRTFTLILTDGADNGGSFLASDVRLLTTDMLDFSHDHIIAGMGIGEEPLFRRIFGEMGISRVLTADSSDSDIDREFQRIERALELAAASQTAFRELMAGSGL